jgi:hypothetical protein
MKAMIPESSKIKERPENLRSQLIRRRKPPVVLSQKSESLPGTNHITIFLVSIFSHHENNTDGKTCRKPSDIDPSEKDSDPTNLEADSSKETGPSAKDHPSDNPQASDNVEPSDEPTTASQSAEAGVGVNQEPPTGNQSDTGPSQKIPEVEAQTNSPPGKGAGNDSEIRSPAKTQESTRPRPGIITGKHAI